MLEPGIADRIVRWHTRRFADATLQDVALKLGEEVGELFAAIVAQSGAEHPERTSKVGPESADVAIVLAVLLARYFPDVDLDFHVLDKLATLERRLSVDGL